MTSPTTRPLMAALFIAFASASTLAGVPGPSITWYTIDGGGGTSTGGGFTLSGTIGQPDAGTLSGGAFTLKGGFWPGAFDAAVARCNPADIANDSGDPIHNPVVPANPLIPNNGVTEADYNAFFAGFFDGQLWCDIAADTGEPLVPFGLGGTGPFVNNGVTEGDYNLFFSIFFNGCSF